MAKKNTNSVQRKNRTTKTDIYKQYGIAYDRKEDKIYHPFFGWIKPLLINGNDKLGRGVYTYSTLATNSFYNVTLETVYGPAEYHITGTCPCHCEKMLRDPRPLYIRKRKTGERKKNNHIT